MILENLKDSYNNLENWRFLARTIVNRTNLSRLRDLSWKFVSHYYDLQTSFPREITNLLLDMINFRIYLHKKKDKTSRKRNNFIQIYFQGINIEKVKLASIFRKHSEIIPHYLNSRDPPTTLYRRSKTIGSTVFNYKDTVNDVITNEWKYDNPTSCKCVDSVFCDPHHQHICTGDLRFIKNSKLRSLLCKGPRYRESQNVNWKNS